jgi:hypothetical protein
MKNPDCIDLIAFSITFFVTHVFYKVTGFNYNISDGLNINLLFDLLLWAGLYFSINLILKKLFSKKHSKF